MMALLISKKKLPTSSLLYHNAVVFEMNEILISAHLLCAVQFFNIYIYVYFDLLTCYGVLLNAVANLM